MLATGFHVTDLPIAEKICGRDGRSLAEVWADGMVSNRSAAVAGFPNLFLLVGPNVGVGHTSMVYMIESQVAYVDDALRTMDAEGLAVLETTPQAQEAYRDLIAEKSKGTVWLAGGCASWYLDKHGHNTTLWPDFTFRFRKLTRKLDRENYVGTPASPAAPGGGGVTAAAPSASRARSPPSAPPTAPSCTPPSTGPTTPRSPSSSPTAGRWPRPPGTTSPTCSPRGSPPASCGWSATTSAATAARPGADADDVPQHRPARRRPRPRVLDQLAPTGPVVLGGHSMGGMTIMCLAAARPELFGDRVRGVALVSTSAGDLTADPRSAAERLAKLTPGMLNAALGGARVARAAARSCCRPTHPRHQKMVREPALRRRRHRRDGAGRGRDHARLDGAVVRRLHARRSATTTSARSSRRSPACRSRSWSATATSSRRSGTAGSWPRRCPTPTLHVVERTGHMLPQERPQLVADAIERLLAAATADRAAA